MKLNKLPARLATINTNRLPVLDRKAGTVAREVGRARVTTRQRILLRDGYACQSSGVVRSDNEVDHRIPLEQGGGNEDANLWTLCGGPDGCHTRKTAQEAKGRGRANC